MDLMLTGVQETVEDLQIDGNGYAFILNYDGTVIAHRDGKEKGEDYSTDPDRADLYDKVMNVDKGNFDMVIDGKKCTDFTDEI